MAFNVIVASASFSRPADTNVYASGDLVADNTVAGSVAPMQFTVARFAQGAFLIRRARLKKSGTTVTNGTFRLHLYGALPTIANGDNAAWSTSEASYLGSFELDLTASTAHVFTDGAKVIAVPNVGDAIAHQLAAGSIVYGLLEARAAYTPVSAETFSVQLEVVQN